MCGRNSQFLEQANLKDRIDARPSTDGGVDYRPRFNIAPGNQLEVITNEEPDQIDQLRWGLVPFWVDEPGQGMINARLLGMWENWPSRPTCRVWIGIQ